MSLDPNLNHLIRLLILTFKLFKLYSSNRVDMFCSDSQWCSRKYEDLLAKFTLFIITRISKSKKFGEKSNLRENHLKPSFQIYQISHIRMKDVQKQIFALKAASGHAPCSLPTCLLPSTPLPGLCTHS